MLHPPYTNIIKFSEDELDLSNYSVEDFLVKFSSVIQNINIFTDAESLICLVIGDVYYKSSWYRLSSKLADIIENNGYKCTFVAVKDFGETQNSKNEPLRTYRSLAWGTLLFKHEYVMMFEKL